MGGAGGEDHVVRRNNGRPSDSPAKSCGLYAIGDDGASHSFTPELIRGEARSGL